ncbi:hypothetical protein E2542_SST02479 [Spatholobus suberectus]|nr:hypothetical protein E2542_SST02479 [Spatholobus suberectus]
MGLLPIRILKHCTYLKCHHEQCILHMSSVSCTHQIRIGLTIRSSFASFSKLNSKGVCSCVEDPLNRSGREDILVAQNEINLLPHINPNVTIADRHGLDIIPNSYPRIAGCALASTQKNAY